MIIAIIILIFEFVLISFLSLGADIELVGNLLWWILFPVLLLTLFTWRRGFDYARDIFDRRLNGERFYSDIVQTFLHPRRSFNNEGRILLGDLRLNDVFISNQESNEQQFGSFLRMLLNLWGFATFVVVITMEIGRFVGITTTNDLVTTTYNQHEVFLFIQLARFAGVVYGAFYVIPSKLLSMVNLRHINRSRNTISSIPSYDWRKYGAVYWLFSFGLFFFRDIFTSSAEQIFIYVQQFMFYFILVGLPLMVYSLIYVGYFEPRIRNQLMRWARDELRLRQSSANFS
jgi:hypothetical protein